MFGLSHVTTCGRIKGNTCNYARPRPPQQFRYQIRIEHVYIQTILSVQHKLPRKTIIFQAEIPFTYQNTQLTEGHLSSTLQCLENISGVYAFPPEKLTSPVSKFQPLRKKSKKTEQVKLSTQLGRMTIYTNFYCSYFSFLFLLWRERSQSFSMFCLKEAQL